MDDLTMGMNDSSGNGRNGGMGPGLYTQGQPSLLLTDANLSTRIQGANGGGGQAGGAWLNNPGFAAEAWINLDSIPSAIANFTVFAHDNNGANIAWRMGVTRHDATHAKVFCLMQPAVGALQSVVGTTLFTTGVTKYLAATYDGVNLRVYVDGVLDGTTAFAGAVVTSAAGLVVGQLSTGVEASLGFLDEVGAYASLSAARILAHYEAGTIEPDPPTDPTDVVAVPGCFTATVTWDAVGTADGYEVRIDGGSPLDVGDVTSHEFIDLDNATGYEVEVRAYNEFGESGWVPVLFETDDCCPPAPTGLTASLVTTIGFTLCWEAGT